MAFPIIRGVKTGFMTTTTTSTSFTLPTGHEEGDLLLWFFAVDGNNPGFTNSPTNVRVTGWSEQVILRKFSTFTTPAFFVFSKIRGSTEPSSYTALWGGAERGTWTSIVIEKNTFATNRPIDFITSGGDSTSMSTSNLDGSFNADNLRIQVFAWDGNGTASTSISGYTNQSYNRGDQSAFSASHSIFSKNSTSGLENGISLTKSTTNSWYGLHLLIRGNDSQLLNFPEIRSISTAETINPAQSIQVNMPSGHIEGDLLIFTAAIFGEQPNFTLSGWTYIGFTPLNSLSTLWVYYRVRTASEPSSYTATWTTNSRNGTASIICIKKDTFDPAIVIEENGATGFVNTNTRLGRPSLTNSYESNHLRLLIESYEGSSTQTFLAPNLSFNTELNLGGTSINYMYQLIFSQPSDRATDGVLVYRSLASIAVYSQISIKGVAPASTSGPDLAVNIGGVWKDASEVSVNIDGVWKTASNVYVNIGGVWKESNAQ